MIPQILDDAGSADYADLDENERQVLLSYLSKLTFALTEDDEVNGSNLPADETLSKENFYITDDVLIELYSNHKLGFSLFFQRRCRYPTIQRKKRKDKRYKNYDGHHYCDQHPRILNQTHNFIHL